MKLLGKRIPGRYNINKYDKIILSSSEIEPKHSIKKKNLILPNTLNQICIPAFFSNKTSTDV